MKNEEHYRIRIALFRNTNEKLFIFIYNNLKEIIHIMKLSKYSTETKTYVKSVIEYITNKYGELPPQWEAIITLLADNLELYQQCKQSVNENGIFNADTGRKNPLLTTMKDLQATIIKQIQHLGLSPYAVSKIKDDKEDDTEDYLNELTNGE